MTSITKVAEAFLRCLRNGQGMGGLQPLLHAQCYIRRTGRAAVRRKDARTVHRFGEGLRDGLPRCSL